MFSQSTHRREADSKRRTPDISKKSEDSDLKKELNLEKPNKSNEKFQIAYKKLLVKSIIFNFE